MLDTLQVNFNEFSSSDIDMGNIPSGFEGFDIPFLAFNLYIYNQISADMKLYLDLYGITDDDTLKIHVEPNMKFLDDLNAGEHTDSLVISFYQDIMSVVHTGNEEFITEHAPAEISIMDHKISDLFSYDEISVSGYALMDGPAVLLPDQALWGDLEIIITPLTIIIENDDLFSFVPDQFTELSVMDRNLAAKIDSGLISATVNMGIENNIPFAGNLLMYISSSTNYFPLCIDSLQTGALDIQEVSSSCISDINDYLNCDYLDIVYDDNTNFVKHLDCINGDSTHHYYENLFNIDFLAPTLDNLGRVLESTSSQDTLILDDEIYYFTTDQSQYLIPRFSFDNLLQDTLTFQPTNSININSYIIFKLLTSGLLQE